MTRKRFVRLCMAIGINKWNADALADCAMVSKYNTGLPLYEEQYLGLLKGNDKLPVREYLRGCEILASALDKGIVPEEYAKNWITATQENFWLKEWKVESIKQLEYEVKKYAVERFLDPIMSRKEYEQRYLAQDLLKRIDKGDIEVSYQTDRKRGIIRMIGALTVLAPRKKN